MLDWLRKLLRRKPSGFREKKMEHIMTGINAEVFFLTKIMGAPYKDLKQQAWESFKKAESDKVISAKEHRWLKRNFPKKKDLDSMNATVTQIGKPDGEVEGYR